MTEPQRQFVLQHPTRGFRDLCHRQDLAWPQLMMVYEHHDAATGGGIPAGWCGRRSPTWPGGGAVADVYDGLLRGAAAGSGPTPAEVPLALECQAGSALDEEMTRCLLATLRLRR